MSFVTGPVVVSCVLSYPHVPPLIAVSPCRSRFCPQLPRIQDFAERLLCFQEFTDQGRGGYRRPKPTRSFEGAHLQVRRQNVIDFSSRGGLQAYEESAFVPTQANPAWMGTLRLSSTFEIPPPHTLEVHSTCSNKPFPDGQPAIPQEKHPNDRA